MTAISDPYLERNSLTWTDFKEHVRVIKRWRHFSLDHLTELVANKSICPDAVVVTFDDGYANNLEAVEYLSSKGIPVAVFVTSGLIGTKSTIWTVEVALLLLHGGKNCVEMMEQSWDFSSADLRAASFRAIRRQMKSLPSDVRKEEMDKLRSQFPSGTSEDLLQRFPSFKMLSWEAVRYMQSLNCTIGSHGVYHEIQHAGQPSAVRIAELVGSKRVIESATGVPCRHFAFPNGNTNQESDAELSQAGYVLGLTTTPETVKADVNPLRIPRFDAPASPHSLFRVLTWQRPTGNRQV